MKITLTQLRTLIREAVEDALAKKEELELNEDELEEGGWGDTTSDDEYAHYDSSSIGKSSGQDHDREYYAKALADRNKEDPYDKPY